MDQSMGSKRQRTLSWPFGDFKTRNCYFDFTASQLWGQAVQFSKSSLFGREHKEIFGAGWLQVQPDPSVNGRSTELQSPCLWVVRVRGACLCQDRVGCCPSKVGHITGVVHSSLLWKLSGCFHQKITFHQKIAFHQKVPAWAISSGFVGEACFWECCSFAGIFLKGRLLHFTMTREGKWPSIQCSRHSHTLGHSQEQASTLLSQE